jgi:FAD/FMN-containing dehydrogenase
MDFFYIFHLPSSLTPFYSIAVVPQGGNTGLVGGSVPVFDEVIINLGLMSQVCFPYFFSYSLVLFLKCLYKVESFDATSGVVVCQAGIVLDTLEKHVEKFGYTIPLDLGAKGR